MKFSEAIRKARKAHGLTQDSLAKRLGVSRAAVNMWEAGTNTPARDHMAELVTILGIDPNLALGVSTTNDANQQQSPPVQSTVAHWQGLIPVFATSPVAGQHTDEFEIDTKAVDMLARPPRLAQRPDVFALHVQTSTMSPWREPGQLVVVDNVKPPRPGEHVVARLNELNDERPRCILGRLVSLNHELITLERYTPRETVSLPRCSVSVLQRVIELDELLLT